MFITLRAAEGLYCLTFLTEVPMERELALVFYSYLANSNPACINRSRVAIFQFGRRYVFHFI